MLNPARFQPGLPNASMANPPVRFGGKPEGDKPLRPAAMGSLPGLKHTVLSGALALKNALTPLSRATFTVIDTETTGLDPATSQLIEVTAIRYRSGREVSRFSTLVNPGRPIPEKIVELTGITDAMVAEALCAEKALRGLIGFVGPRPLLVGHYVNFDLQQIRARLAETGLERFAERFELSRSFCTKTLGRRLLPELEKGSLWAVSEHLGIRNDNPHRALSDVRTTAQVLYALLDAAKSRGEKLNTVHDLYRYQGLPFDRYDAQSS